jgi:hypothetical protein
VVTGIRIRGEGVWLSEKTTPPCRVSDRSPVPIYLLTDVDVNMAHFNIFFESFWDSKSLLSTKFSLFFDVLHILVSRYPFFFYRPLRALQSISQALFRRSPSISVVSLIGLWDNIY